MDPSFPLNPQTYAALLAQGFRRSGGYVYRPLCRDCNACRPARVPVRLFQPSRSQRRTLRNNVNLKLAICPHLTEEHFLLYRRYLRSRHACGGMDPDDVEAFHDFLHARWSETDFWEFRDGDRLLILAVVDHIPNGLSAVYTCFDPEQPRRSLGSYAILRQIEEARDAGLDYLYLGYWVAQSEKMDYKRHFQPLQILSGSGWVDQAMLATPPRSAGGHSTYCTGSPTIGR